MADPIAIWGAVTGTAATVVAVRREVLLARTRLGIEHGVHFRSDRTGSGEIRDAWLVIRVWNQGGRDIALERVGLRFFYSRVDGTDLHVWDTPSLVELDLRGAAIQLQPGGPSHRLYTPLGPVMAATGIEPVQDAAVWAWAKDVGDREWEGMKYPIIQLPPPSSTPRQLSDALIAITKDSKPIPGGPQLFLAKLGDPLEGP